MTILNGKARARDEQLDEVIVAYLESVEKGQAPDAREWQNRYPELAGDLADFFADHDKVKRVTAPLREAARSATQRLEDPNSTVDYHSPSPLPMKIGIFGDYMLLDEISRGGMGIVYLARQISLNRMVAVKMIISGSRASRAEVERFHAEAIAAAHLDHPNIVPIYEVGEVEGQQFYSMKVMEGGSLSDHLAELSGRPKEAAALIVKIAQAVHHAHQRGILHRDLKPGNVLLDAAGDPYVSDFGLSKRMEDVSHSGVVVGTPSYIAPEQAAGLERPTTAADVYSLGAVLYALLTGRPPFQAATRLETVKLVAEQPPLPPRALNALVDRDLETICLKCLEKAPPQRYASVAALAEDLQRYLAGEPIHARPTPLWTRGMKWAKRQPAVAALLAVSLATVFSLIIGYLRYQEQRAAAAELALNEGRRRDSLRSEVQNLIFKGQEAIARSQWSEARVHLTSARRLLVAEPELMDLEAPVEELLGTSDRKHQQEVARREAERKYRKFMELRGNALFQGTLFTGVNLSPNVTKIRETVREALRSFGVALDTAEGPVFEESFTPDERKDITESCYELLLILAETVARDDPAGMRQALRILDRANKLGRQSKAYHLQRARYLKQLGDESGARKARDHAALVQADRALDSFLAGEEFHRQGQVVQAIRAFRDTLRLQPDHFWARYFLAVCYLRQQPARADLASDSLTACLGQGRRVVWVYLLRGVSFAQQELFEAAEDDFRKALANKPNDDARYAILVNRAVMFSRQKKFPRAIADLNQAIALKPNQYQAYANLAKVYQQQKQVASAVKQMDSAIKTATKLVKAGQLERPLLAHLYRNRAFLQMERQESLAALEDLRQAIQEDPQANDHVECGRILHGLQRFQEALIAYDAASKVDSDHADAHLGRAETLFKMDNCKEAITSLDRYLKMPNPAAGPNVRADVYRARGLAGVKLGHYADARDDFTLALSLKEDSATHAYRGWAYLVSKAPQLALLDFEKALRLDENNADACIGRASARVKLGAKLSDLQEAVADAEKALSCGKRNDSRLMWNAARIYAQAAAKLDGERDRQMLKIGARYREQALQLLREALNVTPVAERASFMRKYIQGDADLSRFSRLLSSG